MPSVSEGSRPWRRRPTRSTLGWSRSSPAGRWSRRSPLPTPDVRAERERARFRLHLVHHRTALKNRIHATLMTFGHPVSVADLFGVAGRELLAGFALPEPWTETLRTSLRMVDQLGAEIDACEEDLRRLGADHPSIPLLLTVPQDRSDPRVHD